ncbi:transcription factor TFIIIB component B'' homolog isoform X2 [Tripterygium wilfordii]|nr:transcription factor TFIIIB component B'' homolog isoform X2 [Tripterygium wilfordii]
MLTHSTSAAVSDAIKSHHELDMDARPERCKEVAFPNNDGRADVDDTMLEAEEEGAFSGLDTLDIVSDATVVLRHNGKYQPKPKVRTGEERCLGISHQDAIEYGTPSPKSHSLPSGTEWMNESSLPNFPSGGLDDSSMGFDDFISHDTSDCGFATNEEQANPTTTLNSDDVVSVDVHLEEVPKIAEKQSFKVSERASAVSNRSRKAKNASIIGETNEDEDDDAVDDDDYRVDTDDNDDDRVESESRKKRTRSKSKKPVADKEKPIRKRQRANGAQVQSTKDPPKKFSHSTRRKKRHVDKSLLEMPEDEIDYQRLPIKDLILLADYKERLASKEAKASETPLTDQSTNNTFHEEGTFHEDDYNNEEETLASEKGEDYNDYRANYKIQSGPLYFNHQSYMNKTPRARWSKQDTELFYEAVRQFGTDFSMIQQLFPGRTRHQVKLKYKKEERQHPLMLSEAVTSRGKDHSHFQKVIEQLQKVAAEAEQDYNGDDSIGISGDEAQDLPPETNEELVKSKDDEDAAIVDHPDTDVAAVPSPSKNDEDDFDFWSSYKSAF